MNTRSMLLTLVLAAALAGTAAAQQPATPIQKAAAAAGAALARLQYRVEDEMLGTKTQIGQAVCIDAVGGVFLTRDVPLNVPAAQLKDFELIPPNSVDKGLPADVLGTAPAEGFTFLKVKGAHTWKALAFSRTANLKIGDRVISVGLLGPNAGNVPYLGTGLVAAMLRLPHSLYYVAGGELTIATSPVLTEDGRAVGLVGGEVPMESRMQLGNRWVDVVTMGRQRTRFFLPVNEFADALTDIRPRRLPWIGILRFDPMLDKDADLRGLKDRPAVLVGQVVPGSAAAKAGVKQSDAVVALNGRPLEKLPTPLLVRDNFVRLLRRQRPGTKATLTVSRDGKETNLSVQAEPMPTQPFEAARYHSQVLGMAARDLVMLDRYARRAAPMMEKGVRVFMVLPKSAAAAGQLASGDLVTHVNRKPVPNVAALKAVLDPVAKVGNVAPITFLVLRGDEPQAVTITPPRK